jgi:hypothetical protein
MSCWYTAPNVVFGETTDPGQQVHYWKEEISPDGQQMTLTAYKNEARTKILSTIVLDRIT